MSKREQDKDTLGNRMKEYEFISTSRQLMPNCPVYARIDGRAFHTFCRGLEKPFSQVFIEVMQETCKSLVEHTHACLGYVQSDEISLGWEDITHAPFDGRVQKLESNLASLASAKFVWQILRGMTASCGYFPDDVATLVARVDNHPPSFDCRVFNVPTMSELANCFLWRENDAIKNSILGIAYNMFTQKEVFKKNTDELVHMMRMKGYCFYEDTEPAFMRGTFYHREDYLKELSDDEVARIPESQRGKLISKGKNCGELESCVLAKTRLKSDRFYCLRSHIVPMNLPYRLAETQALVEALFKRWDDAIYSKKSNPTFDLSKREKI